ncbi:excisionase family DNA-binding protein [Geobacter hydrogenophilus]|uniref:excisionase family DNA-binding protein n=1 Tax=Geobacter hydrogenophilus TaxID=40983 RepID=UPI001BDA3D16|nr:excisionase family DNA-binding protein [Geobacter hydrogenophilus]MBT0895399.1 excisionase family DNA-binding protein [Geobacter hydrogenophilus]
MVEIEDPWLSVDGICKYLGVSGDTVHRWINRFGIPAHRKARLWKFKKERCCWGGETFPLFVGRWRQIDYARKVRSTIARL